MLFTALAKQQQDKLEKKPMNPVVKKELEAYATVLMLVFLFDIILLVWALYLAHKCTQHDKDNKLLNYAAAFFFPFFYIIYYYFFSDCRHK